MLVPIPPVFLCHLCTAYVSLCMSWHGFCNSSNYLASCVPEVRARITQRLNFTITGFAACPIRTKLRRGWHPPAMFAVWLIPADLRSPRTVVCLSTARSASGSFFGKGKNGRNPQTCVLRHDQ
ncbi:uncharacterized protein BDZ83DRAFT_161461 [Colletotrichum acutatum]|uniref:Secreted protein n=1 Tax=Glomerella acutata TaxID=27357 RepID=A0AAD8XQH5_GLOAC|nr:uncharacterized protein BDZ83DRAFT_161461 [Colletotrichum acutatum]KAK1731511.1 hypothetical protein BDZ83DRAFT_161461 [Colletotrichum acutatum]